MAAVTVNGFLRITAGTLVCLGIAAWVLYNVVVGLRTGKIRHSGDKVCVRRKSPISFWFHVVLFVFMSCVMVAVWLRITLGILDE
jgi:hypothetical protein